LTSKTDQVVNNHGLCLLTKGRAVSAQLARPSSAYLEAAAWQDAAVRCGKVAQRDGGAIRISRPCRMLPVIRQRRPPRDKRISGDVAASYGVEQARAGDTHVVAFYAVMNLKHSTPGTDTRSACESCSMAACRVVEVTTTKTVPQWRRPLPRSLCRACRCRVTQKIVV
jgi:hypothetical protein